MANAYVLVQVEAGAVGRVTEGLRRVPGVIGVDTVTGPYDAVVHVEAEDVDQLGRLVVGRIQAVPGITRTLTCPIVKL
jgi:DNA-binding Lrp family transcriptional regulator